MAEVFSTNGMIDISDKPKIMRLAIAEGSVILSDNSISAIKNKTNPKGDVLENAKLAAIQAVKITPQLIFMAHPIRINSVKVEFDILDNKIECKVLVKAIEKTGVELEAIAGVMGALLAIFDLSKKYEKDENGQYDTAVITNIKVTKKIKEDQK